MENGQLEATLHRLEAEKTRAIADWQRYRTLCENLPSIYLRVGAAGAILWINEFGAERIGCAAAELTGRSFFSLFHGDDREKVQALHAECWREKTPVARGEFRLTCKNGSYLWVRAIARTSLVPDESGFPEPAALIVCEDITERKNAEAELQESASAWLAVIETVGEGITLSDASGRFEVFNSKMEEITGYAKEEANSCGDFAALLYPDPHEHFQAIAGVQEIQQKGGFRDVETTIQTKSGTKKTLLVSSSLVQHKNRQLFLSAYRDITERKQVEEQARQAEAKYHSIFENAIEGIFQTTPQGQYLSANPALARIYGYDSPAELIACLTDIGNQLYAQPHRRAEFAAIVQARDAVSDFESEIYRQDKSKIWISENARAVRDACGTLLYYEGTVEDITARKDAQEALRQQAERERLMGAIQSRIRQSLNLQEILHTAVEEMRQFLSTDRVLIYRCNPDGSGSVEVESLAPHCPAIAAVPLDVSGFSQQSRHLYEEGWISAVEDIYADGDSTSHADLLAQFPVRARLVVPILQKNVELKACSDKLQAANFSSFTPDSRHSGAGAETPPLQPHSQLWGLLIADRCGETRKWQQVEIDSIARGAAWVGIAIQQSQLYQQLEKVNAELELQVQERTVQLQRALDCEALLKRITDKVRDSLDESQILQTAVQELVFGLGALYCDTALYSADLTTATICYEYATTLPSYQGKVVPMQDRPEIYRLLLQGQSLQFCEIGGDSNPSAILACPIVDDQGVLGDLWLFNRSDCIFKELEIRLVKQVANQCAIAIRQARLYEAATAQVKELQQLARLKDEFLSTVSHELRTPLANMKMAIQMLAIALNQERPFFSDLAQPEAERSKVARYFHILRDECDREIILIDDLLDLQRLETSAQQGEGETIHLFDWIHKLVKPFHDRACSRQQILQLDIASELPPLFSNSSSLARILTELLNNACKYTPSGEQIILTARADLSIVSLNVTNTGVEIPASELPRIFDKFYRIPKADPWQQGGTGLGLTLVKQLVTHLGGCLRVESAANFTRFTVELPVADSDFSPATRA